MKIENLIHEKKYKCFIANDNSSGQLVISGRIDHLNKFVDDLKNLNIPIPSLEEQKIAKKILKRSRDLVDSIQKMQKELDACTNSGWLQADKKIKDNSDIILWDSSGYEKSLTWNYDWIKHIRTRAKKMVAGNITINKLKHLKNYADIVDVSGALETRKKKI